MHKRVDRVEAVCAAALVERGQKGTGNAGERAVRKRERQRGVKDELTFSLRMPVTLPLPSVSWEVRKV